MTGTTRTRGPIAAWASRPCRSGSGPPLFIAARSPMTALLAMKSGGPDPERQGRLAHAAMGPRARVVPVIVIQGDADRTVWAGNGDSVVRQWLTTSRLANGEGLELD